jgi:hypothetical protein
MTTPPTDSQLVYSLWKAGHENFERAEDLYAQIAAAAEALKVTSQRLPSVMARDLEEKLPQAADKAALTIASRWTEANKHAERATEAYKKATDLARKAIYGGAAIMLMIMAAGIIFLGKWVLPSLDQLAQKRLEIAQMEQTINQLTKKGGRANVIPCSDIQGHPRLCVQVDDSVKTATRGLRVISGY